MFRCIHLGCWFIVGERKEMIQNNVPICLLLALMLLLQTLLVFSFVFVFLKLYDSTAYRYIAVFYTATRTGS